MEFFVLYLSTSLFLLLRICATFFLHILFSALLVHSVVKLWRSKSLNLKSQQRQFAPHWIKSNESYRISIASKSNRVFLTTYTMTISLTYIHCVLCNRWTIGQSVEWKTRQWIVKRAAQISSILFVFLCVWEWIGGVATQQKRPYFNIKNILMCRNTFIIRLGFSDR